jgi:hypothetical protein
MNTHKVQMSQTNNNFDLPLGHSDAINTDGLEDLFAWAQDMVSDEQDFKLLKSKEKRIRKQVLELIQLNKEKEIENKYIAENSYLQRRVMALLQAIQEKQEENSALKQTMLRQQFSLQKLSELEQEVKHLRAMTWYREEAEAERKELLSALSKIKRERDMLDELLLVNEGENVRLFKLYSETNLELQKLKSRTWWQVLVSLFKKG